MQFRSVQTDLLGLLFFKLKKLKTKQKRKRFCLNFACVIFNNFLAICKHITRTKFDIFKTHIMLVF